METVRDILRRAYDVTREQPIWKYRLASIGITSTEDDPTVLVAPADGGPRLWFQKVPEPKTSKNRVHLDVRAADRRGEVERLQALGASVLDDQVDGLTVMRDPEANEFCVID